MSPFSLVRVGAVGGAVAEAVGQRLAALLGCIVELDPEPLDPAPALDPGRGQYWSTALLRQLEVRRPPGIERVLGVTEVDEALALDRAGKEAAHELGHTFGLVHCDDYACVMRGSRVADEIDLKGPGFCATCGERLEGWELRPARNRA